MPGWNDSVRLLCSKVLFWNHLWSDNAWLSLSLQWCSITNQEKSHQASRDTCLLANKYQIICIHLLAIIWFSKLDNCL